MANQHSLVALLHQALSLNMSDFTALQARIGYTFKNLELLERALTHSSFEGVIKGKKNSYERLEFLGDRVLGLVIAEYLWENKLQDDQGGLSRKLTQLVRGETCAEISRNLDLGAFILMGEGERASGGEDKEAILADVAESLLAAIYMDGGLEPAKNFVLSHWDGFLSGRNELIKDPKTALQEWSQAKRRGTPIYEEIAREGPDHSPIFTIEVRIDGVSKAKAKGASKREAQQEAARRLLVKQGVWSK